MMILTAIATMVVVTVAHHLGLTDAVAKVTCKILSCNMCCTFWSCLLLLMYMDVPLLYCALLSILSAYASNWFVFVLMGLQNLYDKLWQRLKTK